MALVAGNSVIALSALSAQLGQESPSAFGSGVPNIAVVESNGGGNLILNWANGTRTTVASVAGEAQLLQLTTPGALVLSLYHTRVTFSLGGSSPGDPAGQPTNEGLVIGGFTFIAPGPVNVDMVCVQFSGGDICLVPAALCTIVS